MTLTQLPRDRNILRGLLNSQRGSIIQNIAGIPCSEVDSLLTDAGEAKQFVEQIQQGQVPSVIQNLPQEALAQITDVISIALLVPSAVINFATAAATDAASIIDEIEDGSITSAIEALPSDLYTEVTMGWSDLTAGLTDAWDDATDGIKCLFGDCPSSTALPSGSCSVPAAAAATTTPYAGGGGAAATSYAAGGGAAATSYTAEGGAAATTYAAAGGAAVTTDTAGGAAATPTYQPAAATTSADDSESFAYNTDTYASPADPATASDSIVTHPANPNFSSSGPNTPISGRFSSPGSGSSPGPASSPGPGSQGPISSASSSTPVFSEVWLSFNVLAVVVFGTLGLLVIL